MATTNKAIIEAYKAENGLLVNYPLFTYGAWLKQGYRVRKGEKCKHRVLMWKHTEKKIKQNGQEQIVGKCFHKTMLLLMARITVRGEWSVKSVIMPDGEEIIPAYFFGYGNIYNIFIPWTCVQSEKWPGEV